MSYMKRLLVAGGLGSTYYSFVQLALAKGYSVTALLQNPTFLGSIKVPPRLNTPREYHFPTLKVEYTQNYDAELIDKMAAVLFINYTEDVIVPNEYFEMVEQIVPSMLSHNVKKLALVASDGPMIDETLQNILDFVHPIPQINETVIKYNRNKNLGSQVDLKPKEYSGYTNVSPGFQYQLPTTDQGYMHPCQVAPVVMDAIEYSKHDKKVLSVCRPARYTA